MSEDNQEVLNNSDNVSNNEVVGTVETNEAEVSSKTEQTQESKDKVYKTLPQDKIDQIVQEALTRGIKKGYEKAKSEVQSQQKDEAKDTLKEDDFKKAIDEAIKKGYQQGVIERTQEEKACKFVKSLGFDPNSQEDIEKVGKELHIFGDLSSDVILKLSDYDNAKEILDYIKGNNEAIVHLRNYIISDKRLGTNYTDTALIGLANNLKQNSKKPQNAKEPASKINPRGINTSGTKQKTQQELFNEMFHKKK